MHIPYSKIYANTVVIALAEMEDIFQMKVDPDNQGIPAVRNQDELDLYANFIAENVTVLGSIDAIYDRKALVNLPNKISQPAKNRFLSILNRLTNAHEGVSRQDRLFVHWFWKQIQNSLLLRS